MAVHGATDEGIGRIARMNIERDVVMLATVMVTVALIGMEDSKSGKNGNRGYPIHMGISAGPAYSVPRSGLMTDGVGPELSIFFGSDWFEFESTLTSLTGSVQRPADIDGRTFSRWGMEQEHLTLHYVLNYAVVHSNAFRISPSLGGGYTRLVNRFGEHLTREAVAGSIGMKLLWYYAGRTASSGGNKSFQMPVVLRYQYSFPVGPNHGPTGAVHSISVGLSLLFSTSITDEFDP